MRVDDYYRCVQCGFEAKTKDEIDELESYGSIDKEVFDIATKR